MTEEDTLKLFTNLSRPAVDSMLRDLMTRAREHGLPAVAGLLDAAEERSTEDVADIVSRCLQIVREDGAQRRLVAELEMIQMNLDKLKGDPSCGNDPH
jgi:hypothetical protein